MKKADIKLIEKAMNQAFKHITSDTYELKNGMQFFVVFDKPCSFRIMLLGEFEETIKISSSEAFFKFLS